MQTIAVDSIGPELRRIRKTAGMTLAQVEDVAGVSVGFLSDVERGARVPSLRTLGKLATAYRTTIPLTITPTE